jgi:hypothetical protein
MMPQHRKYTNILFACFALLALHSSCKCKKIAPENNVMFQPNTIKFTVIKK